MKKITAREAFSRGLKRYFTGKLCSHGHIDERMISNGCCVSCLNENRKRSKQDKYEATKVWRIKNPESRTIEARKYREKHPEAVKKRQAIWREKNRKKINEQSRLCKKRLRTINPEKEKNRLKNYYLRLENELTKIFGRPRSKECEICNKADCRIVLDHCHKSDFFRGWICDRCNRVLGMVDDSANILDKLKIYLEKFNDSPEHEKKKCPARYILRASRTKKIPNRK